MGNQTTVLIAITVGTFALWYILERFVGNFFKKVLKLYILFFLPLGLLMLFYELIRFRQYLNLWFEKYAYGLITVSFPVIGILTIYLADWMVKWSMGREEQGKRTNVEAVIYQAKILVYGMIGANLLIFILIGHDFITNYFM